MRFKQDSFVGGISDGSKRGYKSGFQDGKGLDYRTDPDKLGALRRLKKDSGSTVTDLIKWGVENKGDFWFYGDSGKIYKRTSAGVWSNPKTVSSSTGQGIEIFEDSLWYASSSTLGKGTTLTGSTTFTDNYFKSVTNEVDQSSTGEASTYTVTTAVNEGATHRRSFTTTVDNIVGITLVMDTKGTGDVTFVVHDSSNNIIASRTYLNSELPSSPANLRINFTGKYALTIGQTYHIHIYSTVADARFFTNTLNNLSDCRFSTLRYYNDLDVDINNNLKTDISTQTVYNLPTSINENITHRCIFTPNKPSISAISVQIREKGTGDWTAAVHDSLDTLISTATVTNASFGTSPRGGFYRFEFSSALNVTPGAEYHFHLYSTASGSTIHSSLADDITTGSWIVHFQIINNDSDYHPMKVFINKLLIGNGNTLATIDDAEIYDPAAVLFPVGEKVRCIETIGDYAIISTWRGSSISNYGTSRIYMWDGVDVTFTGFIELDGQVNALRNSGNNLLYIIHGTEGNLSVYTGGITPLRRIKNVGRNKTIEVYPGAIGVWEKLLYIGISAGTSTTAERYIWSYGTKDKDYPNSLNKDYAISTGLYDNTVQIGCILGVNASTFFVSWKSGSSYGVDIIDTDNDQSSASLDTLRFDASAPSQLKRSSTISLRFSPLQVDDSITVQYRKNNTGDYIDIGSINGLDDPNAILATFDFVQEWLEVEFRITMNGVQNLPSLLSIEMEFDILDNILLDTQYSNDII